MKPIFGSGRLLRKCIPAAVIVALSITLTGCASTPPTESTLMKLSRAGFDSKAENVCTTTGTTPLPRRGKVRVIGAVDSNVQKASSLVFESDKDDFNKEFGHARGTSYVALCFVIDPAGHVVIAQFPGRLGGAYVGQW